ncbi:protein NLRC3-like isoform X2 [Coregonus clupeaformis]|nr:protein NLRC3-like isoform X2 [Coregonus clupeaformis]
MKKKFGSIFEGLGKRGNPTLLDNIYTELYITTGESEGVNKEHEVWQIEDTARTKAFQDHAINCNDIFKSLDPKTEEHNDKSQSKQAVPVRTVLTKGIAGIGKTVSVQKFILDWAEGIANRDVDFVFALPFRDLNFIKDDYNLLELLSDFHPELTDIKDAKKVVDCKVVFILDGLDESQLPLDFHNNKRLSNVTKTTSVDVLLTNLIKGNLLPSALLWITSRPAAVDKIPSDCFDRVTEVRGFNDPLKEEYFKKRFSDDENLSSKIISHIKTSRSLFIMCHIPVFCWITAMVLGNMLRGSCSEEVPKTLTEMYICFLLTLTNLENKKHGKNETDLRKLSESDVQIILKLGKLASHNLLKSNLVFSEEDLRECDIDINEAFLGSGMCTEIFREEDPMFRVKLYSFVHLSIQEFFAALYVSHCHANGLPCISPWVSLYFGKLDTLHDLHRCAVDKAFHNKNGHLDLFLRFLLGISLESNQILLKCLQLQTEGDKESIQNTIQYIKVKLSTEWFVSSERCINLLYCLIELKDNSLVNEILKFLTSQSLSKIELTPAQCSALAYMLLMSEEVLDEFDTRKYNTSSQGRSRLLPIVRYCRKAMLVACYFTDDCAEILASAIQMPGSHLRELSIIYSQLENQKPFIDALASPNNRLESLDISHIQGFSTTELEVLTAALNQSYSQLHTLRFPGCWLDESCGEIVASALASENSHLRELDLSDNKLTDTGVEGISTGLMSPHCELKILRLVRCEVTSCGSLSPALAASQLEELHLSCNTLGDMGLKLLSAGLEDPHCQIQKQGLRQCNLSELSCESLSSVLCSNSTLIELDLRDNDLGDSGVERLSAALGDPRCALQVLGLSGCLVTEEGCASLDSALRSNPSHLRELDLSYNHPGDSGVKLLSARLEDPHCRLDKLNVDLCGECRIKPGLRKYSSELTLDPDSAHIDLRLSEDRRTVLWREDNANSQSSASIGNEANNANSGDGASIGNEANNANSGDGVSIGNEATRGEESNKWIDPSICTRSLSVHCTKGLSTGRFYWQVEATGWFDIGVIINENNSIYNMYDLVVICMTFMV